MTATPAAPAIACTSLTVVWPDGGVALDGLDLDFATGRTGLIGDNGSGKSTLLRVVAGELTPTSGTVMVQGEVGYLPQRVGLDVTRTVADLLGVSTVRRALRALEAGDTDPAHLAAVGDDWDAESRGIEALGRLGVLRDRPHRLDIPVGALSGGEAVLTGVAGLLTRSPAVSLLDEPSNNLDRRARHLLYDAVDSWPGVLVVATHDRELLEHVDQLVELRHGRARTFGGPWTSYAATVADEREAAERHVRHAEGEVSRERRQLTQAQTKLARRERTGRKAEYEKRVPKVVGHNRKREAQVAAAKYREVHADRLDDAQAALTEAQARLRDDDVIRIELPGTEVPAGREVLRVGALTVRGPERIALAGPNGAGKTMLLDAIVHERRHPRGEIAWPHVPTGYLPQRLDVLADDRSALDNVRAVAPGASPRQVRALLARFLVRGARVDQIARTLSGGERFRISLARLLLAEPPPQLLLLDEPTNSLDLSSVAQLVSALRAYRGALIVVSHDDTFLADIGVQRRWEVRGTGLPTEPGHTA